MMEDRKIAGWPPGVGLQALASQSWPTDDGLQALASRRWPPGIGLQALASMCRPLKVGFQVYDPLTGLPSVFLPSTVRLLAV